MFLQEQTILFDVQSAIAFNLNMTVTYQNLIKPFKIIQINAFCVSWQLNGNFFGHSSLGCPTRLCITRLHPELFAPYQQSILYLTHARRQTILLHGFLHAVCMQSRVIYFSDSCFLLIQHLQSWTVVIPFLYPCRGPS